MPHISISRLFNRRTEKKQLIWELSQRKIRMMERIDSIEEQISRLDSHVESIEDEINSRIKSLVPRIEIACFGVDARNRKIYGGIITFPGVEQKFYKVVDELSFLTESLQADKVSFHQRLKEEILLFLYMTPNFFAYADLSEEEKNIIADSIKESNKRFCQ